MVEEILNGLLLGLVLIFPFGQALNIPVSFIGRPEIRFYLTDILIFLLVIFWLGSHILKFKKINLPSFGRGLLIFLGSLCLSWLINFPNYNLAEDAVGGLYLLRTTFYLLFFFLLFEFGQKKTYLNRVFIEKTFIYWTICLSLTALLQYFFLPDIRFLFPLGWDLHYYRAVGFFLDPNFLGVLLGLGIIYSFNRFLTTLKRNYLFILLLSSVPFFLTYSRSSYLAVFTGLAVSLVLRKKEKIIFIIVIFFLISVILLPRPGGEGVRLERVASIAQRFENWQTALNIWKRNSVFGVGFNNYRYAEKRLGFTNQPDWQESHAGAGVDNSFLFILATSGIIGFLCFIYFLLSLFNGVRNFVAGEKILVTSSIVAVLSHSLTINSFFYPWVMIWIGFLVIYSFTGNKKE